MSIDQINQELKSIIMSFRVTELTQLLSFCNQSKFGRKQILQERALELLKKENLTQKIQFKIRELALQQGYQSSHKTTSDLSSLVQQDSSSNECIITESDMSHTANYNASKSTTNNHQVSDYCSMPKFDFSSSAQNKLIHFNNQSYGHSSSNTNNNAAKNIQFKPIPFDDVIYTLIEPTILPSTMIKPRLNTYECEFKLKAKEANEISMAREFKINKFEFHSQIHLRFCQAEPYLPQDDYLPVNLSVKLNNKIIPLPNIIPNNKPNVESKRQAKPIDLTPFCKLSPVSKNHLSITWSQEMNQKNFCFAIYLSKKLTSKDLLDKLTEKGVTDPLLTQKLIISKLTDTDNEISTTSLKGNLTCPLGKMRLRIPVRSNQCNHIQCFDAELYLQMNEKKPSWLCPVCDKKAEYKTLFIDGLFNQILKETSNDSNEIEFTDDGGWKVVQNLNKTVTLTPQRRKIEEVEISSIKKSKPDEEEIIELSSDSEDDNIENLQAQPLHMPKLSSFGDSNTNKPSFDLYSQIIASPALSSLCSQLPNVLDNNRGQSSRPSSNLITRPTSHGTNSFGNFNLTGTGTSSFSNETNSLRGHSSEVISID